LRPTRSGSSLIVITASVTDRADAGESGPAGGTLALSTVSAQAGLLDGSPLPRPEQLPLPELPEQTERFQHVLPAARDFEVSAAAASTKKVHAVLGFSGEQFAYYDDVDNVSRLSENQYRALDARLTKLYPRAIAWCGTQGDLDDNGRILILFSDRFATAQPRFHAYVDPCNQGAPGPCTERGEFIRVRGLSTFAESDTAQDELATEILPDTIVHEMIHLIQLHAKASRDRVGEFAPPFVSEGTANVFTYYREDSTSDEVWNDAAAALRSPRGNSLEDEPYVLGGLFFYWLQRVRGPAVLRGLFGLSWRGGSEPFRATTTIGESLLFAMFYGATYMHGVGPNEALGPGFGPTNRSRLASLPSARLHPGSVTTVAIKRTGHASFIVDAEGPAALMLHPERIGTDFLVLVIPL
jgi:hypothetical protein